LGKYSGIWSNNQKHSAISISPQVLASPGRLSENSLCGRRFGRLGWIQKNSGLFRNLQRYSEEFRNVGKVTKDLEKYPERIRNLHKNPSPRPAALRKVPCAAEDLGGWDGFRRIQDDSRTFRSIQRKSGMFGKYPTIRTNIQKHPDIIIRFLPLARPPCRKPPVRPNIWEVGMDSEDSRDF